MDSSLGLDSGTRNIAFHCLQSITIYRLSHPRYATVVLIILCKFIIIYISGFPIRFSQLATNILGNNVALISEQKGTTHCSWRHHIYRNSVMCLTKHIVLRIINPLSKFATAIKMLNLSIFKRRCKKIFFCTIQRT